MWFVESRWNDRDLSAPGQVAKITPAGVITEYGTGIGAHQRAKAIVAGPDGNVWFVELSLEIPNQYRGIGRITPSGAITEFAHHALHAPVDRRGAGRQSVVHGLPEFQVPAAISRITPAGVVTEFGDGLRPDASPFEIVAGHDGNLWFLDFPDTIGRIDTSGKIREFPLGADVAAIAAGSDGNVWVTASDAAGASVIVRVKPDGTTTQFTAGITPGRFAGAITEGPDGSLWFVEETLQQGTVGLGRITPEGAITEVPSPVAPDSGETAIATGCDGNLWLTEPETDRVVRFTPPASNATRDAARRVQGVGEEHPEHDDHDEAEEEVKSEDEEVTDRGAQTRAVASVPGGSAIAFTSVFSLRPSTPNSRPIPDCLRPPNGNEKSSM